MGLDPNLFGKYIWGAMHFTALGAPKIFDASNSSAYRIFYGQIPYVIPCASCGEHLKEVYASNPIENALTSAEELFKWTVDVHNNVNKRLGKPVVSVEEARAYWMNLPSESSGVFDKSNKSNKSKNELSISMYLAILIPCGVILAIVALVMTQRSRRR